MTRWSGWTGAGLRPRTAVVSSPGSPLVRDIATTEGSARAIASARAASSDATTSTGEAGAATGGSPQQQSEQIKGSRFDIGGHLGSDRSNSASIIIVIVKRG